MPASARRTAEGPAAKRRDVLPPEDRVAQYCAMSTYRQRLAALWSLSAPSYAQADSSSTASRSSSSDATDPAVSYLTDLLTETRDELTRVDSKAALLLAASGVIAGALLAGFFGGRWTPFDLSNKVQWIWWLGVASAAFGLFSVAAAVYPHIHLRSTPVPGLPTYYGDVAAYEDVDAFRRAIENMPRSKDRLIYQTFVLSRLVKRKYILLQRGLRSMLLAVIACMLAVIINIPLSH